MRGLFSSGSMTLRSALCSHATAVFGILVFACLLAGCKVSGNSFLQFTADFTGLIVSTNPAAPSFSITVDRNAFASPVRSSEGNFTVTYTDASNTSCTQEYGVNALSDEVLVGGFIETIFFAPDEEDPDNGPYDPRDTENRVRLFKNCGVQVERQFCNSENCSQG